MKNYLTLQQAKEKNIEFSEYNIKQMNETITSFEAFKLFAKIIPLVYVSNYDGKVHFEHIIVFIEFKGVLLRPSKRYNEKSYSFFLAESLFLRGFEDNLIEPNKVGKPTEKKLNDWLEYLQSVEVLKSAEKSKRDNKETEFLNKIKDTGLKVSHQSKDGKRGYIETENFDFYFDIQDSGYIEQKITLRRSNTLDSFIKLLS